MTLFICFCLSIMHAFERPGILPYTLLKLFLLKENAYSEMAVEKYLLDGCILKSISEKPKRMMQEKAKYHFRTI